MQIHELNNFSGTPGATDYFATDNGTDTSKISATDLYAPLDARIDNIIAGPASSAEEVIDARLGANGTTYASLGDAIRAQVSDINSDINELSLQTESVILKRTVSRTTHGITYTWNGSIYTVTGTANAANFCNLLLNAPMPTFFKAGGLLKVDYETTNADVLVSPFFVLTGGSTKYFYLRESGYITIPSDAETFGMRLYVYNGTVIDGTAVISKIRVHVPTDDEIAEESNALTLKNIIADYVLEPANDRVKTVARKTLSSYHITEEIGSGSTAISQFFWSPSSMPSGFEAGKRYAVYFKATTHALRFIYFTEGGSSSGSLLYNFVQDYNGERTAIIDIPSDAIGFAIRVQYKNNSGSTITVDESVEVTITRADSVKSEFLQNNLKSANALAMANIIPNYTLSAYNSSVKKVVKKAPSIYNVVEEIAAGATAISQFFWSPTSIPDGFKAGKRYAVYFSAETQALRFIYFTEGGSSSGELLYNFVQDYSGERTAIITIPADAIGFAIRVQYTNRGESTISLDDTVDVSIIGIDTAEAKLISNMVTGGVNENVKMMSVGNSFLTGAVWVDNHYDHLVNYEDSVYGQIAISLNLLQKNVDNTMLSSAGLTRDAGSGSFMDKITSTSLEPYDYLLTHLHSGDINHSALGSVNSTDNDGTIAGAVIHLVNYVRSSNGKCRLILLGVPPYSSDPAKSGTNVFTGNWDMGYSIGDTDRLLYKLSRIYHFIYVAWEDLDISYHYIDYMDYLPGSTSIRHAKEDSVYRCFGEYAALQVHSTNSPIALGMLVE